MKIKIRILRGPLTKIVGKSEFSVQSKKQVRVIDVLRLLAKKYGKPFRDYVFDPKKGVVNSYLMFALNGVNVSCIKGTETQIEDGSELLILSATGGG